MTTLDTINSGAAPPSAPSAPLDTATIKQTDTATLRKHLVAAIGLTAKTLAYLGTIWAELERRGEDLSELRSGLAEYLPLIASGRLDPELVVNYTTKRMFLVAASRLSLEAQRELVETGTVLRITVDEAGGIVREQAPIRALHSNDLRYIFADDRLRPEAEQLAQRQKAQQLAAKTVNRPRRTRRVEVDAERACLLVGRSAIPIDRALEAISEFYDIDLAAILKREQETRRALSGFQGKIK